MNSIWVEVINGSPDAVTLRDFSLPAVTVTNLTLPVLIHPHSSTDRMKVGIADMHAPDDQFGGHPLTLATPTIRYEIGGVKWERHGDDPALRLDT